jgi:hypothetical protein
VATLISLRDNRGAEHHSGSVYFISLRSLPGKKASINLYWYGMLFFSIQYHSLSFSFIFFSSMEFIPNKIDLALMLWSDGDFLATKVNGKRVSLYKYKARFYVIWYTEETHIDKVEIVDLAKAKEIFKDHLF